MPRARRSSISRLREAKAKKAREFEKAHKAAEQGDAKAQFYLGAMDGTGEGVPENYIEAHMWWALAKALGFSYRNCDSL